MITYDVTMQGKPDELPKEVAEWLLERNSRYPKVEFIVGYRSPHPQQIEEFESLARKYSRLYSFWNKFISTRVSGINVIVFPYLSEQWSVKIVGGINQKGEIADLGIDEERMSLPATLRAEIAGLPITPELPFGAEKINENVLGIIRKADNAMRESTEMVRLQPDGRETSELSLSGDELNYLTEFAPLMKNPKTRDEAVRLFYSKDWEGLKRLKEQNS